ncbi:cytochrome b5-related protein-like [Frankliniella occidentalis]|uniref:Cytochrome b5-related protein-like n=1 Tax=Frankliniella occidentalis TaxID=133901 RepID=A0A6J1SHF8_FRAOC|nr:cytochrome b5-related protein-like [Frankliniella occidentalis]XP_026280422.1 cytochrome b5-related protein-like [Frankliniella occidentalis]XP_052123074.1 cytochrome b5-related protein-like [Frankliniella occidentalis]
MPPNVKRAVPLSGECDCGQEHDPDHVHEHDHGLAAAPAGSRWHGLGWAYPKDRDKGLFATVDGWLADRRRMDGAEGLWRVEDNLYDLTPFMERHPGGRQWLELTKGIDVTELFFSHHISETAEALLPKFLVRPAAAPRNSPFTFHRDGFYMQLRERVRKTYENIPKQVLRDAEQRSENIVDALAVSSLLACFLAVRFGSYLMGGVAGLLLSLTCSGAHNFFHKRQNWRRYYFELSFMSSREWMVSHAMSHHVFPNTFQDLEVTFFEPLVAFLPYPHKNVAVRYLSWGYCAVLYAVLGHGQFLKRLQSLSLAWTDAVALAVPAAMLLSGAPLWDLWLMWTWVLVVSSLYFAMQGLSAGHHHPDNYHEGDALGADNDYGLMQLAATGNCTGLRGRESLFFSLTHFGDHRLHHLFPAVDHAVLPFLEAALAEHMIQYRLKAAPMTTWEALKGKYLQMARTTPNWRPPINLHQ